LSKNYIGLATSCHDPAVAILNQNGELLFAEATERFLQNKRAWNCAPDQPTYIAELINQYCDPDADLVVAKSWSRSYQRISGLMNRLLPVFRPFVPPVQYDITKTLVSRQLAVQLHAGDNINRVLNIDYGRLLDKTSRKIKISERLYDHHLCHATSACFSSEFDEASCVIIDGMGEDSAYGFYRYQNGRIEPVRGHGQHPLSRLKLGMGFMTAHQSLGIFYSILTEVCGFDTHQGEDWKLMGLSSYGQVDEELYHWLRPLFQVEGTYIRTGKDFQKIVRKLTSISRGPDQSALSFANLAYTGQRVFCDVLTEMLQAFYLLCPSENLVLGGGCALNSAWVGTITENTPFERVHVPSAPADDGNCIGAAWLAYRQDNPDYRPRLTPQLPYLGADMDTGVVDRLSSHGKLTVTKLGSQTVHRRVAELLAEGNIIGWVQGRAEFGPRALGNRSILADPRDERIRDRINALVKFREEFRPFAPSILHEFGDEYFENYQESPYMDRALRFRPEVRSKVPGVVHVDGTGRLQTVKEAWNPGYYRLINSFHEITGIPLLLNTSFNIMGKPIAHSVEDCIAVFFTSGMDVLIIGDQIIEKRNLQSAISAGELSPDKARDIHHHVKAHEQFEPIA
jgi:carbamoyltransferase